MAKSTAVATRPTEIEQRKQDTIDRIKRAASEMARPETTPEEMAAAILDAASIDDILGNGTVVHLADMIGESFTILGASLSESTVANNQGLPVFAIIEAELNDGTQAIVTTGATNCVAQLIAMHSGGYFPQWVKCRADETKAGNTVYRFVKGDGERPTRAQLENF